MIAADTSRSRAYIQAMANNRILPNHVLILGNDSHRPGQYANKLNKEDSNTKEPVHRLDKEFDPSIAITHTLKESLIPFDIMESGDINDPYVIELLKLRPEKVFIYSGFGGVLLKKQTLDVGKRFLHVHGGYLPDYKGSTTNYFSLLSENEIGASSLFLSEKIDSGNVLVRKKFRSPIDREKIDHIYDSEARASVLITTLKKYCDDKRWDIELPKTNHGETYYIIHPVLKHLAILANK
jgi:methionyl-tRNA formyltransferase